MFEANLGVGIHEQLVSLVVVDMWRFDSFFRLGFSKFNVIVNNRQSIAIASQLCDAVLANW
jgi:hypothetical protein